MSTAVAWDGDTAAEKIIIDPADFEAVDSIKITFTYGIFK